MTAQEWTDTSQAHNGVIPSCGTIKEGIPQDRGVVRILTHHLVIHHKPHPEKLPQVKGL